MIAPRANSSLVAVFFILLVIAGVIYLFWQNNLLPQEKMLESNTAGENLVTAPPEMPSEVETTIQEELVE